MKIVGNPPKKINEKENKQDMKITIPKNSFRNGPVLIEDLLNSSFDSFRELNTPKTISNPKSKDALILNYEAENSSIFKNEKLSKKIKPNTPNQQSNRSKTRHRTETSAIRSYRNVASSLERDFFYTTENR